MAEYDWLVFTKRVTINARKEEIFKAWSTQKGLETFFLQQAFFESKENRKRAIDETVGIGDSYEWSWYGYPDSLKEYGKIIDLERDKRIAFSFTQSCLVAVEIKSGNGINICELSQSMQPAEEAYRQSLYIECGLGWTFYLANLKSVLEGGIDLRNKDESIQQVINA